MAMKSLVGFLMASLLWVFAGISSAEAQTVGIYDVFEQTVTNAKTYSNPFDFNMIELRTSFTSPTGRTISFFGFHDGDGVGGQSGNVWKFRFMPDETGTWTYNYTWTDGTPGGSGDFFVNDTGVPGPAKLDPANPKLLVDARGNPIHWRGYSVHNRGYTDALTDARAAEFINTLIEPQVISAGYNALLLSVPSPSSRYDSNGNALRGVGTDFLWGDYTRFNVRAGRFFDTILTRLKDARIWTVSFTTFFFSYHSDEVSAFLANPQPYPRWFTARYAPFYNFFSWSPAWEMDQHVPSFESNVGSVMRYVRSIDPWQRLQGAHDTALSSWQDWQSILPSQWPSRTIFNSNIRTSPAGASCLNPYNKAIIAYEHFWETTDKRWETSWPMPRDATEVRRALWGGLFANMLPIYDEQEEMPVWQGPAAGAGNGVGEPEVKRAYDWWYSNVGYRNPSFDRLNSLVSASAGQICSGIPGEHYVVYDQDGGNITINLSAASGSFSVLWFDPKTGAQQSAENISGGGSRTLSSPFSGDSVLLLKLTASPPPTVTVTASNPNAREPKKAGQFQITRTGSTNAALTVSFSLGGTATNGTDYTGIAGSIILAAGTASKLISVTPKDDKIREGDETVVLTLSPSEAYAIGSPNSATVTIADND
jgi:hypothetical protein